MIAETEWLDAGETHAGEVKDGDCVRFLQHHEELRTVGRSRDVLRLEIQRGRLAGKNPHAGGAQSVLLAIKGAEVIRRRRWRAGDVDHRDPAARLGGVGGILLGLVRDEDLGAIGGKGHHVGVVAGLHEGRRGRRIRRIKERDDAVARRRRSGVVNIRQVDRDCDNAILHGDRGRLR